MKIPSTLFLIISFFFLFSDIACSQSDKDPYVSPDAAFGNPEGKMYRAIKGKKIVSLDGQTKSIPVNGFGPGGGVYRFEFTVDLKDNQQIKCESNVIGDSQNIYSVVTTNLKDVLRNDRCIRIEGAFDKYGVFVARKIQDPLTGVTLVWFKKGR